MRHHKIDPVLSGLPVLTKGNEEIVMLLKKHILAREVIEHSYPYDWRSQLPVIIRSCLQWFVDIKSFKEKACQLVEHNVHFHGASDNFQRKKYMIDQIMRKPDWCISRQRVWGVGIPVFYDEHGSTLISKESIEHIISLTAKHGSDCWWTMNNEQLLCDQLKSAANATNVTREKDVLEVWMDSGVSWNCAMQPEHIPADVVLEGVDQFRGWFMSLLLTCVASADSVPYKNVITHGFAVDEQGKKMSKSAGNVVVPFDVIAGDREGRWPSLGADGLRYWVANYGSGHAHISIGADILNIMALNIKQIRNIFKFLIGCLNDFRPEESAVNYDDLRPVDKYMLTLVQDIVAHSRICYDKYDYCNVSKSFAKFIHSQVSAFYTASVKNRIYCYERDGLERRSAQTCIWNVTNKLICIIAPILPHMTQELKMHCPLIGHDHKLQCPDQWDNDKIRHIFADYLLPVSSQFLSESGDKNLNMLHLHIEASPSYKTALNFMQNQPDSCDSDLVELFRCSSVSYQINPDLSVDGFHLIAQESNRALCDRCRFRKRDPNVHDHLCFRCYNVVNS